MSHGTNSLNRLYFCRYQQDSLELTCTVVTESDGGKSDDAVINPDVVAPAFGCNKYGCWDEEKQREAGHEDDDRPQDLADSWPPLNDTFVEPPSEDVHAIAETVEHYKSQGNADERVDAAEGSWTRIWWNQVAVSWFVKCHYT